MDLITAHFNKKQDVTSGVHCLKHSSLLPFVQCHVLQRSTHASVGMVAYLQGRECMHMDVWGTSFGGFQQLQVCLPCISIGREDSTVLLSAHKPPSK